MKTILLFSILFCVIVMPLHAQLSESDLNQIRLIVKDEVRKEIAASETRMKEHIDLKISSVEKQITLLTNFVYGLIALIVVAIGIPQIIIAWRSRKDSTRDENIDGNTREIKIITETPTQ